VPSTFKEPIMAAIDSAYRNEIQKHLGYFGIFPPNRPVKLGDIGKRKGDEWEKQGTINRWIEPKEKKTPGGPMIFTSNGDNCFQASLKATYG
jgi:hypothetical protein